MAARNQHVRQSRRYVERIIDGQRFHFYPHSWEVSKSKLYSVSKRATEGKVAIPEDAKTYYGTTIVYVHKDGTLVGREA